jgi:GntR family transcriptional regulator/MocR family aminotransferase
VLAEFLSEGHFARHVRRMRALYAERQQVLVIAAQRELAGLLEILPAEAGLHLTAWLPPGANDRDVSDQAAAAGIIVPPLSAYTIDARIRPGLMLGYAALPARQIREGVRKLALVLNSGCNSRPSGLLRLPRLHL